jgi:AraC-like DNA-binding protein
MWYYLIMKRSLSSPALSAAGWFKGHRDIAEHVHDGMELVYVPKGHCACEVARVTVEARAGDLLVLPDGVPHSQRTYEPTATCYVAARSQVDVLSDHPRVIAVTDDRIVRWMGDLIDAHDGTAPMSPASQAALLLALLQRLADLEHTDDADHPAVRAALDCMRKRLAEPGLSLDAVAEHAGVSSSHLSLLFRRQMGTSPIRLLARMRMDRAMQRLKAPYEPIKAVAGACGFVDVSYFCRQFRRHTGISPGEFRRKSGAGLQPKPGRDY